MVIRRSVPEEHSGRRFKIPPTIIDVAVALGVVVAILIAMFIYTGIWPPLVVVESKSMQHDGDTSSIGTIDTGDLVLVKKAHDRHDIKSYLEGVLEDYRKYGDYGDVIIYRRGGSDQYTPIIHRVVIYLEANPDGESFSAPILRFFQRGEDYDFVNSADTLENITGTIRLYDYGFMGMGVDVPVGGILSSMSVTGLPIHSGFITKGDFNPTVDQVMGPADSRQPVAFDWIVGKARGEIPWFGIMKLWVTGALPDDTPSNSIRNLWISLILIVAVPLSVEIVIWWRERRLPDEEMPHIITDEDTEEVELGRSDIDQQTPSPEEPEKKEKS